MRQFFIKNALGQEWDLNSSDGGFYTPSGLGFTRKMSYQRIGSTQYTAVSDILEQKKIKGNFVFKNYERYQQFIRFIQKTPLMLKYKAAEEFMIRCDITSIEKGEKTKGLLQCKSTLTTYGTFYKTVRAENVDSGEGKKYEYRYDYTYFDNLLGTLELESDSVLEAPTKLTILGPVINPSWIHTLNGKQLITGKVNCNIPSGHRLVIDSTSLPAYSIKEYDQNGIEVSDHYQDSDFSTRRFILLGYGTNRVIITHEGEGEIKAYMEGEINYESV